MQGQFLARRLAQQRRLIKGVSQPSSLHHKQSFRKRASIRLKKKSPDEEAAEGTGRIIHRDAL